MQFTKVNKNIKTSKKWLLLAIIVLASLALLVYLFTYWWLHSHTSTSKSPAKPASGPTINYGPPTAQEKQESSNQKQQTLDRSNQNGSTSGSSSTAPPPSSNLSVFISRASQSAAGQPLNIRTIVYGTSTGTCQVTLTKSGQNTVSESFTISAASTYATCSNADIPASAFGDSGQWNLSIIAENGSSKSPATTSTVNITK